MEIAATFQPSVQQERDMEIAATFQPSVRQERDMEIAATFLREWRLRCAGEPPEFVFADDGYFQLLRLVEFGTAGIFAGD